MVRVYKKKIKSWNEATINVAIQEITDGAKIMHTAEKYRMSVGLLWNKLQNYRKDKSQDHRKRVILLSENIELHTPSNYAFLGILMEYPKKVDYNLLIFPQYPCNESLLPRIIIR